MRLTDYLRTLATAVSPRVHGNGFLQFDLSRWVRLHVWGDDRIPKQTTETPVHDHRFGFTSRVLYGALTQRTYNVVPLAPEHEFTPESRPMQPHVAQLREGEDSILTPVGDPVALIHTGDTVIDARTSQPPIYAMAPGEIHETVPMGPAVSIIVKTGLTLAQGGPPPRVFVPIGVMPSNDFHRHRVLSADAMWAILDDALARDLDGIATGLLWSAGLEAAYLRHQIQVAETLTCEAGRVLGGVAG